MVSKTSHARLSNEYILQSIYFGYASKFYLFGAGWQPLTTKSLKSNRRENPPNFAINKLNHQWHDVGSLNHNRKKCGLEINFLFKLP
jgi:hypothetical protein